MLKQPLIDLGKEPLQALVLVAAVDLCLFHRNRDNWSPVRKRYPRPDRRGVITPEGHPPHLAVGMGGEEHTAGPGIVTRLPKTMAWTMTAVPQSSETSIRCRYSWPWGMPGIKDHIDRADQLQPGILGHAEAPTSHRLLVVERQLAHLLG